MNYGRYQIIKKVGEGMMGVVYQAHDPRIDRTIALKVLREDRVQSEEYVQRFLKEAVAIGRINHQNIVAVYDIGQDHDTIYIAMEFIDGCGLDQLIKERQLSFTEIVALGRQIAEALDYAHQKGVVHRDVKPSNIIVLPSGSVKLTDFGVARIEAEGDPNKTQLGVLIGSPAYMAPEQVKGQPIDGRADLYALGVILFELATGQKPFTGGSIEVVFSQILQGPRPDPEKIAPRIPRQLRKVILTCLEQDPAKRYQTGAELAAVLQDCLEEHPDSASWLEETRLSPSHLQKVQATPGKRFNWILLLVVLFISVSGALALKLFYFSDKRQEGDSRSSLPITRKTEGTTSLDTTGAAPGPSSDYPGPPEKEEENYQQKIDEGVEATPSISTPSTSPKTSQSPDEAHVRIPVALPGEKSARITPDSAAAIKHAYLDITSIPTGAELYVDGKLRGQTPARLTLTLGKHEVRLSKAGHYEWEAQMQFDQEQEVPVNIKLVSTK
jgi:serine/threonine-protein kinase